MESIKNKERYDSLFYIGSWILLSAVYCVFFKLICCRNGITYDSSYQFFLNKHGVGDLFYYLKEDYSAPLYTVYLKIFSVIFGDDLITLRASSIPLFMALFYLALFPFRRLTDKCSSITAAALFMFSGYNVYFATDIRPTVLGYVLSAFTVVYAMLVYFEGEKKDLILFTVFASASMYSHNVSLIFAFFLYLFLIVASLIEKKKDKVIRFLVSGIIVAVLYIPWLFVIIYQLNNIRDHYWRSQVPLSLLLDYSFVKFMGSDGYPILDLMRLLLFVAIIFVFAMRLILGKNRSGEGSIRDRLKEIKDDMPNLKKMFFLFSCVLVAVIGFYEMVIVMTQGQRFAARYFMLFSGVTIIAYSTFFCIFKSKKIIPVIAVLLVCTIFVSNMIGEYRHLSKMEEDQMVEDLVKDSDGTPVFMHFHEYSLGLMLYYFPEADHYVSPDTKSVLRTFDVFSTDLGHLSSSEDIWNETDVFYILDTECYYYSEEEVIEHYASYFEDRDTEMEIIGHYPISYCSEVGDLSDGFVLIRVSG